MATAPTRTTVPNYLDPSVANPLDILRGTIRRYVVIEGLLSAAIFVAAWFALGLVLDFGVFKIATWDWVLDAPKWLRAVALVLAVGSLGTIVTLRIFTRLRKELSYPALALVLERRFPQVLGDRLITAVELADVERTAAYGYSAEMVRATIAEARERVATVPVNDVFNWTRLRMMAVLAGGLMLLVLLTGFISYAAATGTVHPYRFGWRFGHVTGTYLERNVFLMNTPWPRRAHLELAGFPGEELRVGKDAQAPTIKAKAYQWVVADRNVPMGWRPMVWGDLNEELLGGSVPELPAAALKAAAETPDVPDDAAAWPLDQVKALALDDAASRAKLSSSLGADAYLGFENGLDRVFKALDEQADKPSMGRTLRKLDIPEKVTLVYRGLSKSGDVTLSPGQNNEFAGVVSDLKESVQFVIRAEDFRTPSKTITLVPPPLFTKLVRTEYQPAYLHHAPPQNDKGEAEGYPALRGRRQKLPEKGLSLTGDRSIFSVPSGTELVLTATADTDLIAAYLQPKVGILPGAKPGSGDLLPLTIGDDKRTVTIEFLGDYRLAGGRVIDHGYLDAAGQRRVEKVTTTGTVEFDLIVIQGDNVPARRQVMIQVIEDQPPIVEVAPDVIRKVGNVYYVTPNARIPFNPESVVRDDHGLSKVAYEFTYWPEDTDIGRALRMVPTTIPFLYPATPITIPGVVAPAYYAVKAKDLDKGDKRRNGSAEVGRFFDLRRGLRSETRPRLQEILKNDLPDTTPELVKRVEMKSPDSDYFDLKALKLAANSGDAQTRYRLDLNITATDTNYDTGPKTAQNQEMIRLLIVSEGELLGEINKEEEAFGIRLDEALAKIAGAKKKYEFVRNRNGVGGREDMDTAKVRVTDASQDIAKAQDIVQGVAREYTRIHRECLVNRVTEVTTVKFRQFGNRIERVLGEIPAPASEEEKAQVAAGLLTPKMTFPIAEKRLENLLLPLAENRWADPVTVSDTEIALTLLELEVSAIRKALGENQSKEKIKQLLSSVIDAQKKIRKAMEEWRDIVAQRLKLPQITEIGPVFLTKGETKKLKHGLNWGLYDKDDLVIKMQVFDVADKERNKPLGAEVLGVAPQFTFNFEQIALAPVFEYDVKAGAKEGEYRLVLTPDAGTAVEVVITIK